MDGALPPGAGLAYAREMAAWQADPPAYWLEAARGVDWVRAPQAAFALRADGQADWFPGGALNMCANALDRHVAAGHGARTALIWENAASKAMLRLDYASLRARVARCAGGLRGLGVGQGDRVFICLPPVPECLILMLACARLGAVHVVAFDGLAPAELSRRIADCAPRLVVTASCRFAGGRPVPLLPGVREAAGDVRRLVLRRAELDAPLARGELDYARLERHAPVPPVAVASAAPLYILYTSGTSGQPKGVVRDHGGHAVALVRSMRLVYGLAPGEMFCTTAGPGWVVGHSYGVYGPLLIGAGVLMLEAAGTRDVWPACARHRVAVLFTAPSFLRAAAQADPPVPKLPALRHLFLAGERADAQGVAWARRRLGVPVLDHWWQTETGSALAGSFAGLQELAPDGVVGRAMPGVELAVLDEHGCEVPAGASGEIALRLPLPPGCLTGLWRGEARYFSHPGYYRTFDYGRLTASGQVVIEARTDDVLNVAGRRLGTGVIEDVLAAHPDVAACAVVGVAHALRGEVPVAFVVPGPAAGPALPAALVALVRARVGRFAGLRRVHLVAALPRTPSGKIIRRGLVSEAGE